MKNLKNGFLALALIAGVAGGFATKSHAAPKLVDPTYDWLDNTGHNPLNDASVATARSFYSCPAGTAIICANGSLSDESPVTGPQSQTIKKN